MERDEFLLSKTIRVIECRLRKASLNYAHIHTSLKSYTHKIVTLFFFLLLRVNDIVAIKSPSWRRRLSSTTAERHRDEGEEEKLVFIRRFRKEK